MHEHQRVHSFIIPLCSNELRILNPYWGCSIREIPASFDSAGTSPSLPGALSCAEDSNERRKSAGGRFSSPVFPYFCVFSLYFRVNRVGKSYRNAIINYLCESKTKIRENPRWSSTSGSSHHDGQDKDIRPTLLTLSRQVIFRFYLII